MKLLIFGASGGTGRELLEQSLDQGHAVTALVRDPDKIKDVSHTKLRVMAGSVLDAKAVENAMSEQEAVLFSVGAGTQRSSVREEGTKTVIEAMEKAGVRRLVCQTSLGVGESRSNLSFLTKYVVVDIFLRHAFADHERQERVLKQCLLDWIVVRPPHLLNGPRTGAYRHGFATTDKTIQGKISRADVADFMLKQLTDDTYLRQTPGVSY
jgi:putative NADH-flavin reductase